MMSKKQKIFLYTIVGLSYIEWALLLSLLPPFYPSEAESKGCSSSQVINSKHNIIHIEEKYSVIYSSINLHANSFLKFQYGWVFGIANLAAFLFAPLCGKFGAKIGVKYLYKIGAFLQASVGFLFGFLVYVDNTIIFLALSYILM